MTFSGHDDSTINIVLGLLLLLLLLYTYERYKVVSKHHVSRQSSGSLQRHTALYIIIPEMNIFRCG